MVRPKIVIDAGSYDPAHSGHFKHLRKLTQFGDYVWVIMNSDEQIIAKYGYVLQPIYKRIERLMRKVPSIKGIVISIDKDSTQVETLSMIKPYRFVKGAEWTYETLPEAEKDKCKEIGCEIICGVSEKINSTGELRKRIERMRDNR